ncbi:hypothetical protein [Streptomyces sp. NPDC102487]|uniref:hypothetical protein n=1 Tax=Streptomyces sp. NPDC102487 TaxID=3366182 RepID=UPI0037F42B06
MSGHTPEESMLAWIADQQRDTEPFAPDPAVDQAPADVPPQRTEPEPPQHDEEPPPSEVPPKPTAPPRPLPAILKPPAEAARRDNWILRLLHPDKDEKAVQDIEPDCTHPRVVPVNNIYGDPIAQLCLVCDEQLDLPADEESGEPLAPSVKADVGKKAKAAPARRSRRHGPVPMGGGVAKPKTPGGATVKKGRRSRIKPALFTGSAAAVGYAFGLVQLLGVYLPVAEQAAVGMVGLLLAVAGGWGAWRLFGRPEIARIFPVPILARVLATLGAAELCRRMAPAPVDWLNDHGQQWGLGASAVSLLLTAGGMCVGLWWLIDSRVRHKPLLFRWLARIPLASALLATALYAPGTTR